MQKMYSGKIQTISDPSNVTMITEDGIIAEMIIEVDGDSEVGHTGSFSPKIKECTRVLSPSVVSTMSKFDQCSENVQKLCSNGVAEVESTGKYVPKKNKILKNGSSWNIFNFNKNNLPSNTPVEDVLMELNKEKDDSELQNNQSYPEISFSTNVEPEKLEVESNILKDTEKSPDVTPVEEVKVARAICRPMKRKGKRKDAKSSKMMRMEENLSDGAPDRISEISIETMQKGPDICSNLTDSSIESCEVIMNISANKSINAGIGLDSICKEWKNLGSISHINERVNGAAQYSLKTIHRILFDQFIPRSVDDVKKEILEFDGFFFTNDSQHSKNRVKLMKLLPDFTLKQTCDILGLNDGTKEEMISNILSFLFETFNAKEEKIEETLTPVVSLEKLSNDLVRYQSNKSDGNEESKTKPMNTVLPENNVVSENSCTRVLRSSKKLTAVQTESKPVISKKKETKIGKGKVSCKDLPSINPAKMESELLPQQMGFEDSSSSSSSSNSSESTGEDILADCKRKMLGQLPEVRQNISKCTSQQLQRLHAFLFNNVDKPEALKRNVLQFNGFKFRPQSSKWMRKEFVLSLIAPSKLKEMADLLHLPCFCQKQRVMISTIMKFLSFPQESLLKSYAHDPVPVLTAPDNRPSTRRKKRVAPLNNNNESCGVLPVQSKMLKRGSSPVSNKFKPEKKLKADENLKEMKMLLSDIRRKRALKKSGYSIRSVNNLSSSSDSKKKLESIPNVQFMVITSNYEDLQDLHQLLYLRPASKARIRRNILDFDGFTFEQDSDYYEIRIALLNKLGYEVAKRIAFFLGLASLGTNVPHQDLNELILHFLMCPSSIQIKPITHFPQNFFNNLPRQSSSVNVSPVQKALKKQGSNKRLYKYVNKVPQTSGCKVRSERKEKTSTQDSHEEVCTENDVCEENPVSQKIARKVKMYPSTCKVRKGRKRKFSKRIAMLNSAKKASLGKKLAKVSFEEEGDTLNTGKQEEEDALNAGKQEKEDTLDAGKQEKENALNAGKQEEDGVLNIGEQGGSNLSMEEHKKKSILDKECYRNKGVLSKERHERRHTLSKRRQGKGNNLVQEKGNVLKQEKENTLKQEKGSTQKQGKESISKQKKENTLKHGETSISDEEKKSALIVEEEQGKESISIVKEQKMKTLRSSKRFRRKTMVKTKKELKEIESLTEKAVPPVNINSDIKDMGNNVINSGSNISFKNTVLVEPIFKTNYTGENVLKESNCDDVNKLNNKNAACNEKVTGIGCLVSKPPSIIKRMEITSPGTSSTPIKSLSPLNEKLNVSPEGVKIRTIMLAPPGSHPGNSLKAVAVLDDKTALYPRYLPASTVSTSLLKFNPSTFQTSQINSTAKPNIFYYKSPPLSIQTNETNSSKNQTGISQNFLSNSNCQQLLYQDGKAIHSVFQKQGNNVLPTQSNKLTKGSPNLILLNEKTSLMQSKNTGVGNDPRSVQVPIKLLPKIVAKPCATKANSLSTCSSLNKTSSFYHNTAPCENTLEALAAENDGKALFSELQKCLQKINQLNSNKNCQRTVQIIKLPNNARQSSLADSIKNGKVLYFTSQKKPVLSATASMENTNIHSISLPKVQNKSSSLNTSTISTTEADDLRTPNLKKSDAQIYDDMKNLFVAQDHKHPSHPVLLTSKEEYVLPCDISSMTENLKVQVDPKYDENFIDLTQEDTTGSEQGNYSVSNVSVKSDPVSCSSKHPAAFSSDSDYDEEPLSHLIGHPSDETLFKHVYDYVICSSLSDITMRSVVQKIYDLYPQYDLSYRKSFLKDTVKKIVCSISSGCWPKG